ncbi:hypothetical protein CspeluHIS016_0407390 [Cutaneotrichosporon spelunceum]|uniref:histidine kinase n=1 Tax=Cutaneotrichosporon spelunceum TaxID=1672016 RepID=A0AAD3YCA5_9TREE|nr:hypothetical protein CspeluHIS016_0407390 [Cutaneotrichosporon spelunceum]
MGADGDSARSEAGSSRRSSYPLCGAAFVRHLHADPRSNHVHLPTDVPLKGKALRVPFHRVSSLNDNDAVAPPESLATKATPPASPPSPALPTPLHGQQLDFQPCLRSSSLSPTHPPQPLPLFETPRSKHASSKPGIQTGLSAAATPPPRHITASPVPLKDDRRVGDNTPDASNLAQSKPRSSPLHKPNIPPPSAVEQSAFQQTNSSSQFPDADELAKSAVRDEDWEEEEIRTVPAELEERAGFVSVVESESKVDPAPAAAVGTQDHAQSGSNCIASPHSAPPTIASAPASAAFPSMYIAHETPSGSMTSPDSTILTPPSPTAILQQSLDRPSYETPKLLLRDHHFSAATMRLASSNLNANLLAPLHVPSPDSELTDPTAAVFNSAPNLLKASSDPGPMSATFTRSASSHWATTIPSGPGLTTIAASPPGTPGDLSGLPPSTSCVRGLVHPRIPSATAPLPRSDQMAEPNRDYFGSAVVTDEEGHEANSTSAHIDYAPPRSAAQADAFYREHHFYAAPPSPHEAKRLKALYSFNIMHTSTDANFDRIVHMIKLVFKVKIGFITMVDGDHAWFKAKAGFDAQYTSRATSFCGHTILADDDEPLVVLDALKDWRFCNNPNVVGPPNVRFYAGAPLQSSNGYNVGSLCLVDDTPRPEFPPRSRHILKEFAAIVMREMALWRDRLQLRTRDKIQTSMEKFTRECLEIDEAITSGGFDSASRMNEVYTKAAKLITNTLELDGCTILDISQFERVEMSTSDGERKTIYHANPYAEGDAHMVEPAGVFGPVSAFPVLATAPGGSVETRQLTGVEHEKMSAFLADHRDGRIFEGVAPSWIKYVFPPTLKYGMVVPVIGLDKQPFALICAYTHDKGKQFLEGYELQFLRGIGVIILSAVLRRRMLLADRSKSVLISSVSHELRTPLHGILAASELLGDSSLDQNQEALLSTVRTCGLQLIDTVNHVLDFTKLSGGSQHMPNKPRIELSKANLTDLILQTVESCWLGARGKSMQQTESSPGSFYAPIVQGLLPHEERVQVQHALAHVETVLDLEPRKGGWNVICETGGLCRSLMNIYSNALKYTKEGYIQVVLLQLAVIDTGKGIGKAFLKDQIFQPFSQEDPLHPGTGLGLAIVNSIMRSEAIKGNVEVWSIEGEGTEVRLTLDVDVVNDPTHFLTDRTIGKGLSLGFINYNPTHRGLQLSKEVMKQYAEYLGYSIVSDYRDADVLAMNELGGIDQDNLEVVRSKPTLLMVTFKIWSRDKLNELGLLKDQYVRVMCKPMVRYSVLYELERAARYIRRGSHGDGSDLGELPSQTSEMALDSPGVSSSSLYEGSAVNSFEPQVKPTSPSVSSVRPGPGLSRRRSDEDRETKPTRPLLAPRGMSYHPGTPNVRTSKDEASKDETPSSQISSPSSTISLADGSALLKAVTIPDELSAFRKSRPPRVMVVEDNVINRRVLTAFLRKRGCEYQEVVDGSQGVKLFEETPPNSWDIILMDINMPIMNGLDATRAIRAAEFQRRYPDGLPNPDSLPKVGLSKATRAPQRNHSKIFALTGLATADDKRQAFGSGVDGYLVKPVSLASLDMVFKKIGF